MTTKYFVGRAGAVAQVETLTISGTVGIGDTVTVTINSRDVTFTAAAATTTSVATGLAAALEDTDFPEFQELSWEASGSTVVGTAITAGIPHTITVSDTGTVVIGTATTIAATGPNHWDNTDNWGGSLPSAADDVVLADDSASILYGWPGSEVVLGNLRIESTYSGDIGLPKTNANGYREYRQTVALNVTWTSVRIYGSGTYRLHKGAAAADIEQFSGTLYFMGLPNTAVIEILGGNYFHGISSAETALASVLRCGQAANVTVHDDSTATTIYNSGALVVRGSSTTITQYSGTAVCWKNPTNIDVLGGYAALNGSENMTAVSAGPGYLDLAQAMETFTIGTWTPRPGVLVIDPNRRVSGTFGTSTINYN